MTLPAFVALFAASAASVIGSGTLAEGHARKHEAAPPQLCAALGQASHQDARPVATGTASARIILDTPDEFPPTATTRMLGVTVQPQSVNVAERYVVTVFARPAGTSELDRDEEAPENLGGFSYFAPPRIGVPTEFFVRAPQRLQSLTGADRRPVELEIRLVPIESHSMIEDSRLEILDVRRVP